MKKQITITLEVDSDDEYCMVDAFIKDDLATEIGCCSNFYEIKDICIGASAEIIRCKDCAHYDGRPCGLVNWYNGKNDFCSKAEKATVTQIAEAFHEAIENTVIAEDEYPHLREKLHKTVDAECERLRASNQKA